MQPLVQPELLNVIKSYYLFHIVSAGLVFDESLRNGKRHKKEIIFEDLLKYNVVWDWEQYYPCEKYSISKKIFKSR